MPVSYVVIRLKMDTLDPWPSTTMLDVHRMLKCVEDALEADPELCVSIECLEEGMDPHADMKAYITRKQWEERHPTAKSHVRVSYSPPPTTPAEKAETLPDAE